MEKGSEEPLNGDSDREKCIGFGLGSSKKEGQQNAAKMALILYGYLKDDQFENSDIFYPDWDKIDSVKDEEDYIYSSDKVANDTIQSDDIKVDSVKDLEKLEVESDDNGTVVSNMSEETLSD